MADPLQRYREKRNFSITPEPAPQQGAATASAAPRAFVVQKHWATRLHYDLRLEIDGTQKSWAVPKGPSLDPADKRMAVQVEDHPLSYNTFEGQIPAGQYGAGRVIVWDKGVWEPVGDAAEGWRQGRLKFVLHGYKLRGHWTLVRMGAAEPEGKQAAWLLIKEHDEHERSADTYSVVDAEPDSVASLGAPALAEAPPAAPRKASASASKAASAPVAVMASAPKARLPATLQPQLDLLVDAPPPEPAQWMYELKFDGYRILGRIDGKTVRLFTRTGQDWSHKMPHLIKAL